MVAKSLEEVLAKLPVDLEVVEAHGKHLRRADNFNGHRHRQAGRRRDSGAGHAIARVLCPPRRGQGNA